MSIEAVLTPASFGWVSLQLHYDGRHPPMALLDELATLGWSVPAPPSRPASAIDWYTPDPETGQRFTVRPWHAIHDIDPPGRHAAPAIWHAEQRAAALRALASAFAGHDVVVSSSVPELVALATGVAPESPPPDRRAQRAADRRSAADRHLAAERQSAVDREAAADQAVDRGPAVVSFMAPVERRDRIEAFLRSSGLAHRMAVEIRVHEEVFRGTRSEKSVPTLTGEVLVRRDAADELRVQLRAEQVASEVRVAAPADVARLDPSRNGAGPAADVGAGPGAGADPRAAEAPTDALAVLRVEVSRTAGGVVDRVLAHPALAGLPVTVSPTTRLVASRYRGSVTEVQQPCLSLEVSCPPGQITIVRAVLAEEAGVSENEVAVQLPGPEH